MGGDFEFYCLQLKVPVGMAIRIRKNYPSSGDESSVYFFDWDEILGFFSSGTIFQLKRAFHRVCDRGCILSYFSISLKVTEQVRIFLASQYTHIK